MSDGEESFDQYNIIKIGTPATGGEVRIVLNPSWTDSEIKQEIERWLAFTKFAFELRRDMGFPESSRSK